MAPVGLNHPAQHDGGPRPGTAVIDRLIQQKESITMKGTAHHAGDRRINRAAR